MVALVRCVTERGRESMEDSGTMLAHISSLKEMLDQVGMNLCLSSLFFLHSLLICVGEKQVNEEIEANIEITREIESSIVKCEEIEADLATREADLIKTSALLQFDTVGYVTVAGIS